MPCTGILTVAHSLTTIKTAIYIIPLLFQITFAPVWRTPDIPQIALLCGYVSNETFSCPAA